MAIGGINGDGELDEAALEPGPAVAQRLLEFGAVNVLVIDMEECVVVVVWWCSHQCWVGRW